VEHGARHLHGEGRRVIDKKRIETELDAMAEARAADHAHRVDARRRDRAERTRRRTYGLAIRHAEKLARVEARLREAQINGQDDSWYEEPE
jgi:hypothetical protein